MYRQNAPNHDVSAQTGNNEFMGPSRDINYSPKLTIKDIESMQKNCFMGISSMPVYLMTPLIHETLKMNSKNQKELMNLKQFSNVFVILKQMMEPGVDYNTFPMKIWNNQEQSLTWNPPEKDFYSHIAIILTDY
ncbi:hypothetical protein HPULCUR_000786 [Helicostylum pulchrum]|uniref:Uncharacterized protein n=1 Tax=Helicostylum pulchrum TaxID=562976 RepID=A0ABP9XKV0_9FUNG